MGPRPSKLIKTSSQTNIPVFVGCYSNSSSKKNSVSNASTPVRPYIPEEWDRERKRSRTSSNSSIPIPTNLRTRTPTGGGIQRSGSNLAANNRTSNTQTTTASSYSSNAQNQAAQQATRNW